MHTEEQARAAVVAWAKVFFVSDAVEVKRLTYDTDEMNWTAMLSIGTSPSPSTVTFLMDDVYVIHLQTIGGEPAEAAIERDRRAWEADMKDMQQIKREWEEYRNE